MNEPSNETSQSDLFALFRAFDEACRAGDMNALRIALGNPDDFSNTPLPPQLDAGETVLLHAIHFAPVPFIGDLVNAGADVKFAGNDRVPPLFAAILSEREDRVAIMELLLDKGADIGQTGYNDWTPLHLAVNASDAEAVAVPVRRGADPYWRASEDQADTSAFDDALAMGFDEGVEAMLNASRDP